MPDHPAPKRVARASACQHGLWRNVVQAGDTQSKYPCPQQPRNRLECAREGGLNGLQRAPPGVVAGSGAVNGSGSNPHASSFELEMANSRLVSVCVLPFYADIYPSWLVTSPSPFPSPSPSVPPIGIFHAQLWHQTTPPLCDSPANIDVVPAFEWAVGRRPVETPPWQPIICSRTLMGVGAPHQCSLGAAACYLLFMLTAALLMTSLHSEGTICRS